MNEVGSALRYLLSYLWLTVPRYKYKETALPGMLVCFIQRQEITEKAARSVGNTYVSALVGYLMMWSRPHDGIDAGLKHSNITVVTAS